MSENVGISGKKRNETMPDEPRKNMDEEHRQLYTYTDHPFLHCQVWIYYSSMHRPT